MNLSVRKVCYLLFTNLCSFKFAPLNIIKTCKGFTFCDQVLSYFVQMKKVMQKDAARTEDVVPYNIIPLDALSSTTNAIVTFPEVIVQNKAFCYWQFSRS